MPCDLLVVVVTYNSASVFPGLAASLEDGLAGTHWQLVVVDNDSTDGSPDVVRRIAPHAQLLQMGRNAGYAAAINVGAASTDVWDALLILNPDVRLGAGCAARLHAAMVRSGAGLVGPRLVDGEGALIHSIRRAPAIRRVWGGALIGAERAGRIGTIGEVVTESRTYDADQVVDWLEGSTLLISRECWERVGPWDERFFLYSEETDYALRIADAGLGVRFVAEAQAVHLEGGSATNPALWPLLVTNQWRLFRKRRGRLATSIFWAGLVTREGSRALLGRETSRAAFRALTSRRRLREAPGPPRPAAPEPES